MIADYSKSNTPISLYQPSREVIDVTKNAKDSYEIGTAILNKPYEELNNYSVIERMNKDQRTFNSYVDETVEDPEEGWRWKGTRGMARNRAMAMHAHLTATLAVPMAFAQNEKQEEDKRMSNIMRDLLMWVANNSEYRSSYILATMGTLVNPVTYLNPEYVESYTTVKDTISEEDWKETKVLDEINSGVRCPVFSADQVLITNAYEQNIQRQSVVIKKLYKSYEALRSKWGWHENWYYVKKGWKAIYSPDDGLFYDVYDEEHKDLCEEATVYERSSDTEITYIGGIYFGTPKVDYNPIKHRDNRNIPKVPLVPFGYQRINEHFYFWKSLMNIVGWDHNLLDAMYENTMNRETLDIYSPLQISGVDPSQVSGRMIYPASVVAFENPDAKAQPILSPNRVAGYQAMREIEKSMSQSTISDTQAGELPDAEQKAFNVARAEQNARTILRGTFRSIGESVILVGDLFKDITLQHLTTAQVDEITGSTHYRPFILTEQMVNGKKVSKKILFDEGLMGRAMSKDEIKKIRLQDLSKTGYPKEKEHVYRVNPHLFSKMKYLITIQVDEMFEKNEAFEKAMSERLYVLLRQDPLVNPEAIVRDLLNANYHGGADERMVEAQAQTQVQSIMGKPQAPQRFPQSEATGKELPSMV